MEIDNICCNIAEAFEGILSWKPDPRLNAILAEFESDKKGEVRDVLERFCGHVWTNKNITSAPASVQAAVNSLGGLMAGQLFFTTDPEAAPLICGAWWPWGSGYTISIRISSISPELSAEERSVFYEKLKAWFKVS